jgi:hypothetical protein
MTTTYAVTFRCDDGRAPGCRIRLVYDAPEVRHLDRGRVQAERAGWVLGFASQVGGGVTTVDVCPACAGLPTRGRPR